MTSPKSTRYAITGANGYVGRCLKAHLQSEGSSITEWTRSPPPRAGVTFHLGADVGPAALEGVDGLVHCAYDFRPLRRKDIWAVNVNGSRKLLQAARTAGVGQIVVISTISAFEGCRALYGQAKLEIEAVARDLGCHVIRPGLVYGDSPGGMFGRLVGQVRNAKFVPLIHGGAQTQYLVHETDLGWLVSGCLAGVWPAPPNPITLAHQRGIALREILVDIASALDKRVTFVPVPWRLLWLALKALEAARVPLPFRSDSLVSLIFQNPSPSFDLANKLGARCRPFNVTPAMVFGRRGS